MQVGLEPAACLIALPWSQIQSSCALKVKRLVLFYCRAKPWRGGATLQAPPADELAQLLTATWRIAQRERRPLIVSASSAAFQYLLRVGLTADAGASSAPSLSCNMRLCQQHAALPATQPHKL